MVLEEDTKTVDIITAINSAEQLCKDGKNVLIACDNRLIAEHYRIAISKCITIAKISDYIESIMTKGDYNLKVIKDEEQISQYYEKVLPSVGADFYSNLSEKDKFDSIILYGFRNINNWIQCVEKMKKSEGQLLISGSGPW